MKFRIPFFFILSASFFIAASDEAPKHFHLNRNQPISPGEVIWEGKIEKDVKFSNGVSAHKWHGYLYRYIGVDKDPQLPFTNLIVKFDYSNSTGTHEVDDLYLRLDDDQQAYLKVREVPGEKETGKTFRLKVIHGQQISAEEAEEPKADEAKDVKEDPAASEHPVPAAPAANPPS